MMFEGFDRISVDTGPFTQLPQCIGLDIGQLETRSNLSFPLPKAFLGATGPH